MRKGLVPSRWVRSVQSGHDPVPARFCRSHAGCGRRAPRTASHNAYGASAGGLSSRCLAWPRLAETAHDGTTYEAIPRSKAEGIAERRACFGM